MKIVSIVSGGLDSVVMAYHFAALEHKQTLMWFNYGQRHSREWEGAYACARAINVQLLPVYLQSIGERLFGKKSAIVKGGPTIPTGHYEDPEQIATIVPNRNALMLSFAYAFAIGHDYDAVAIGAHKGDRMIYPDCRLEFFESFEKSMRVGNDCEIKILAPFLDYRKVDIVSLGAQLDVPFGATWTCYVGGDAPCGKCAACVERAEAFKLAGVVDPLVTT